MMKYLSKLCQLIILSSLLFSCGGSYQARVKKADNFAANNNFTKKLISTSSFLLTSYQRLPDLANSKEVAIYIEGDGLAWLNQSTPSPNPTPREITILELANKDPRTNVAYIAKPCQYTPLTKDDNCDLGVWTDERYQQQTVTALNEAVDVIAGEKDVHLIGYSGGGGLAVIVAARNSKVKSLVTLAGNLDHVTMHKLHGVEQIPGYNPINFASDISHLPQLHISGQNDEVVPSEIAKKFMEKLPEQAPAKHLILPGVNHYKGWEKHWPDVLSNL